MRDMKEDKPSKLRATLDEIKKDAFEAGFHAGWFILFIGVFILFIGVFILFLVIT